MSDSKVQNAGQTSIRSKIFSRTKSKSIQVEFFGETLEIRQPSMRQLFSLQADEENLARRAARMIIEYSFIPGTNDKVFDKADLETIENMPFGQDLRRLQDAITELTGIGDDAQKDMEKNSEETSGN